ncbi:MAG: aminopeptidase P family protein [Clostridia bacterium]|nr:aminopeptidase P family protein [Clostridia bacterium]
MSLKKCVNTETNPTPAEFQQRIARLFHELQRQGDRFDSAIIYNRVNQYYLTGTMQDGLLVVRKTGDVLYFVRKSFERARLESHLRPDQLVQIHSYRDLLSFLPANLGHTFLEMEAMPLAVLERLRKYVTFASIHALDGILARIRSVKSPFELALVRESARQHSHLMEHIIPGLLREGMSEAELLADTYAAMVKLGHHGLSRFAMPQIEMVVGQIGFGESSLYPTSFDGPGGMTGLSAAVPGIGSRDRRLQRGDLVFVDIGYGFNGYHSDKTRIYSFGAPPLPQAALVHAACIEVINQTSALMVPGATPEYIYQTVMADLPAGLTPHFMGYGEERVKFLGHGIGLVIDEQPVIARGFKEPLQAGMVIALEPKCGIDGIGMVGVEETYEITPQGAVCLTGGAREIMTV